MWKGEISGKFETPKSNPFRSKPEILKSLAMKNYHNPGVYSEENSVHHPLVQEVETALPAFVGYTAKATRKVSRDLLLVPTKIHSMREFENLFGFPFENEIEIFIADDPSSGYNNYDIRESSLQYILYFSVKIFFDNGGGSCYILSVDAYRNPQVVVLRKITSTQPYGLMDGLHKLSEVTDLSLIVIPEAVKLPASDYSLLVQAALLQCHTLGNRFAIFDLYHGDCSSPDINLNKGLFGSKYLTCGSAYYPFVKTKINSYINSDGSNVNIFLSGETVQLGQLRKTNFSLYKFVKKELKNRYVVLPSCGAIAGAYVTTDKSRGVWKSPANLDLACVSEPVVRILGHNRDIPNVDTDISKTINSIRASSVKGKETLVWGARTLAGDENEGQYVPVCRFIIMVKESLLRSTSWASFELNDENTWNGVRTMIVKYLTLKWQEGALAGVIPQQAFYVNCGIGSTMTDQDILYGSMNIEIGLAVLSPSEFLTIRITQQMRSSKVVVS
jgi:phage tail sheath protein FI